MKTITLAVHSHCGECLGAPCARAHRARLAVAIGPAQWRGQWMAVLIVLSSATRDSDPVSGTFFSLS